MNYPEPDAAVIATARANLDRATDAVAKTQLASATVIVALQTCTDEKSRLLDLVSVGKVVEHEKFAEIDTAIATNESSQRNLAEILARQESAVHLAADELRAAHGLAQRPRVVAAIRELHEAGQAAAAPRQAQIGAENRAAAAKDVILAAFGAGFPCPPALRPQPHTIWTGHKIPAATHPAALRATWGELADEALADTSESVTA